MGIPFLIEEDTFNIQRNFYLVLGGIFKISDNLQLKPSLLVQKTAEIETIYDNSIWAVVNDRFWFDFAGHPHTEQLHTIERYERVNYGTLRKTVTIIDPGAYEKPFTVSFDSTLRPGWDIMEYICNENNQDVEHIVGPAGQGGNQAGRL